MPTTASSRLSGARTRPFGVGPNLGAEAPPCSPGYTRLPQPYQEGARFDALTERISVPEAAGGRRAHGIATAGSATRCKAFMAAQVSMYSRARTTLPSRTSQTMAAGMSKGRPVPLTVPW